MSSLAVAKRYLKMINSGCWGDLGVGGQVWGYQGGGGGARVLGGAHCSSCFGDLGSVLAAARSNSRV